MAAMLDEAPIIAGEYMSVRGACEYAGVTKQSVFYAISKGRLHPLHIPGLSYRVFFRSEVIAWRQRFQWRPLPRQVRTLVEAGYHIEDFTPLTPDELADSGALASGSSGGAGGAPEASGAFVAPSDLLAAMQHYMREGQALTASVAPVVGSATESAMRGWLAAASATGASGSPPDIADVAARVTESAIRPIAETIRANVAPLTEAMAQAALPRPTPPTEDVVARQMGALRVELAQLLTRIMNAIRPMVERLAGGGYVTPEDVAPFMALIGELAGSLAGSPFYELSPRDAPAQMPAILARLGEGLSQTPTPPAREGNTDE